MTRHTANSTHAEPTDPLRIATGQRAIHSGVDTRSVAQTVVVHGESLNRGQ